MNAHVEARVVRALLCAIGRSFFLRLTRPSQTASAASETVVPYDTRLFAPAGRHCICTSQRRNGKEPRRQTHAIGESYLLRGGVDGVSGAGRPRRRMEQENDPDLQ